MIKQQSLHLQLWHDLKSVSYPFSKLLLKDQYLKESILFTNLDLITRGDSEDQIGWILDHRELMSILFAEVKTDKKISMILNYDDEEF